MGDHGNEYDDKPPAAPLQVPSPQATGGNRVEAACQWLRNRLSTASWRLRDTRADAERVGISAKALYAARDAVGVREIDGAGGKWWSLPEEEG